MNFALVYNSQNNDNIKKVPSFCLPIDLPEEFLHNIAARARMFGNAYMAFQYLEFLSKSFKVESLADDSLQITVDNKDIIVLSPECLKTFMSTVKSLGISYARTDRVH